MYFPFRNFVLYFFLSLFLSVFLSFLLSFFFSFFRSFLHSTFQLFNFSTFNCSTFLFVNLHFSFLANVNLCFIEKNEQLKSRTVEKMRKLQSWKMNNLYLNSIVFSTFQLSIFFSTVSTFQCWGFGIFPAFCSLRR